jgi:hypothetical protein
MYASLRQLPHLTGSVFAFKGGQVTHRDSKLEASDFAVFLDRPLCESASPLFDIDLVNWNVEKVEAHRRKVTHFGSFGLELLNG